MGDDKSAIGTTVTATISNTSGEFTVAKGDGETLFVYGDVSVGDQVQVRIIDKKGDIPVCITNGAELKLRIEESPDAAGVTAEPAFGPVRIEQELTVNDWWRCTVTTVEEQHVQAKAYKKIPRRSAIDSGPLPESPTQSLNRLVNNKHNDS